MNNSSGYGFMEFFYILLESEYILQNVCSNLTPNVMPLEGEDFGWCLGHEGRYFTI